MSTPGFPLLDLVIPSIDEIRDCFITPQKRSQLKNDILSFINRERSYESLLAELAPYPTVQSEVNKISIIMNTENQEIPKIFSDFNPKKNKKHSSHARFERKKTQHWTDYEDCRLLMAIRLFGLDNWNAVADYVGNGRLRSQCMQRWSRCLDPRISKKQWTKEEEERLIYLVREYKNTAWTQIAEQLGNRSDVQCRYKYSQLCRTNKYNTPEKTKEKSTFKAAKIKQFDYNPPVKKETNDFDSIIRKVFNESFNDQLQNFNTCIPEKRNSDQYQQSMFGQKIDPPVSSNTDGGDNFGLCSDFSFFDLSNVSLDEFN